jgi:hypothetical protein
VTSDKPVAANVAAISASGSVRRLTRRSAIASPARAVDLGPAHISGPARVQVAQPAGPRPVIAALDRPQAVLAEPGPQVQDDLDLRGAAVGDDPAEHDGAARVDRERECLVALGDAVGGDPAAAPDQRAFLV